MKSERTDEKSLNRNFNLNNIEVFQKISIPLVLNKINKNERNLKILISRVSKKIKIPIVSGLSG